MSERVFGSRVQVASSVVGVVESLVEASSATSFFPQRVLKLSDWVILIINVAPVAARLPGHFGVVACVVGVLMRIQDGVAAVLQECAGHLAHAAEGIADVGGVGKCKPADVIFEG